jgi:hypothetical protein
LIVDGGLRQGFAMFNFEKLETWQKAINFADFVYEATRHFPADERFGLANQMRRSAVSISSNIAAGSLFEVVSQSFVSKRQGFLSEADFQKLYAAAEEQGKMLSGLRCSVLEGA